MTSTVPQREVIRIGIPEANFGSSSDIGVEQFFRMFSYESLSKTGPDGRTVPALAEGWRWEPDGLQFRIQLRKGVFTHDGQPLTATVVAEALRIAVDRPGNRELYVSLGAISGIKAEGDNEVLISLSRQAGALPDDLNMPLPLGAKGTGTGPYRVAENAGKEFVLERFERYYGGQPAIKNVVIRPYTTMRTAWTSLLRGEIDMVTKVPADAAEFLGSDRLAVTSYPLNYQYLIAFNSRRPPFGSPAVRRALNIAIDRDRLVNRVLAGRGRAATGPLWPQHWAIAGVGRPYTFDPSAAASLLDNAGVPLRIDRSSQRQQVRFSFTCLVLANFRNEEKLALEVQKALYDIGVDVKFETLPPPEYVKRILSGDFDAILTEMVGGPALSRPYIFWRSARSFKGAFNTFGYENPEVERLFSIVLRSSDDDEIRSAARQLQNVFWQDPPALFLTWNEQARAVTRDFRIVQEPGRDPLVTLWRWQAE